MKFEVGEIALTVTPLYYSGGSICQPAGAEVEILWRSQKRDWAVRYTNGEWGDAWEWELRKRRPPEEPSSWDRIEEITKWNPTREGVNA